ncbi:TIGR04206 family protein [Halogeometricum sp. wsp3]|nr:TIGR04206 family protein [Halogeometricum sp. wsp3]
MRSWSEPRYRGRGARRHRVAGLCVAGFVVVNGLTVVVRKDNEVVSHPVGVIEISPANAFGYCAIIRFTSALPQFIESWGSGVLLYAFALASAVAGVVWREDVRVTALALAGAGLTQFPVFLGFNRRLNYVAVPVGSLSCFGVRWYYLPAIRRTRRRVTCGIEYGRNRLRSGAFSLARTTYRVCGHSIIR